ncbi:hypothetical protein [Streptomyces coffeae]|uniref:Uncharacterized protein n=1 Tax=Streptomyces coffeae TaxID=621382 RepID=A0ABS1NPY0_9ACTN|nr:hypothetical protein [Streptomyces coffeae]MBL1101801.1 hypothetical protein [Streptomyces coffeae]
MSGFTRDTKYYGDRLVYEPLERKWAGYHARHCGCGQDWLEAHAVPAGFTVIPRGKTGYYGLVGPGLTEGVDDGTDRERVMGGGDRQAGHPADKYYCSFQRWLPATSPASPTPSTSRRSGFS